MIVPSRTFVGTATAVVARGGRPVAADVDRVSGNLTAETIKAAMTPVTKCIIPVHLAGWPCDMQAIMEFADSHGLIVIEDCAQAHGARWNGRHVGTFGHAGAFSFCQDKIMTTAGEGGMLITNDEAVWQRAWAYKDHGRSMAAMDRAAQAGGYEFKYAVESFGTNWRMTEVQAAIGRVQLGKLDVWVEARRRNAALLDEALLGIPGIRITVPPPEAFHSYYKYYAHVDLSALQDGWTRARILSEMNARGVVCLQGTCTEIYREKAFVDAGFAPVERLPVAAELDAIAIMLLVDPTYTESDILRTAVALREVMVEATGA